MEKVKTIPLLFLLAVLFSCEETVTLDLETSKERLVIEALIYWEKGTPGNQQVIRLTKTAPYFSNGVIPATGANVIVTKDDGSQFNFTESENGVYLTDNFIPEIGADYTLNITYNNEEYIATETLISTPSINRITQSVEDGFDTENAEISVFFNDTKDVDNYYVILYSKTRTENGETEVKNEITLYDDQFEDGNELMDFFEEDEDEDVDFLTGDEFEIFLLGVSKQYYNFLILIDQQADADTGPFTIPSANVKGNCINTTNTENYPYGFFSLNEVDIANYTFQ